MGNQALLPSRHSAIIHDLPSKEEVIRDLRNRSLTLDNLSLTVYKIVCRQELLNQRWKCLASPRTKVIDVILSELGFEMSPR